jgi:hypothetical protein
VLYKLIQRIERYFLLMSASNTKDYYTFGMKNTIAEKICEVINREFYVNDCIIFMRNFLMSSYNEIEISSLIRFKYDIYAKK